MTTTTQIGVIGAGAWGTALAIVAARNGHRVVAWDHNPDIARTINRMHKHPFALSDIDLDPNIVGIDTIDSIIECSLILAAVPAQFMRTALLLLREHVNPEAIVVLCAKGIEVDSGHLMSEVADASIPGVQPVILSGPSFASEVAAGLPTAITVAADRRPNALYVAQLLGDKYFRTYVSEDPIGAQIAGASKNVLAIGCGIAESKGLGKNAIAALITRGIAEINRLSTAMGGCSQSMLELAGIGDLVLTCTNSQSRNFSFGYNVGQEKKPVATLIELGGTVEGFASSASILKLSRRHNVVMPIIEAVHRVLHQQAPINSTISELLTRSVDYSS